MPVLLLSQLNRDIERRAEKEPQLADLRDSGNIEQDADIIAFLHRPATLGEGEDESETFLLVKKHRNGETGKIALHWDGAHYRFSSRTWRNG